MVAIITWFDDRNGNNDIYAQRINSSGATLWTTAAEGGVSVCTQGSGQTNPTITSDGSNGAIITWFDGRAGNNDIYAQRIDMDGSSLWTANGLPVCTLTSGQLLPDISSDGSGGAIITWSDARNSTFYDIYAQRINSSGTAQWATDGIAISTVGGKAVDPVITGDASGGIIAWRDTRNVNSDIYASKASPDGVLPVELTSFSATVNSGVIMLKWMTATEIKNYGFEIERTLIHSTEWQKIGFVQGNGNSNSPKEYSFADNSATSGKYAYRLKQIDNDGTYKYSNEIKVDLGIPTEFSLQQNYPNPFNPTTTIQYNIPITSFVKISVYDILGKEIKQLVNELRNPGHHEIIFDAKELASGIYYYTIRTGEFTQSKKLILLK